MLEHLLDQASTNVSTIEFLNDALVDGFALSTYAAGQNVCRLLVVCHRSNSIADRFQQRHSSKARFNVKIEIMTLLFRAMQGFFVNILAMSDEARVLRRPGRV